MQFYDRNSQCDTDILTQIYTVRCCTYLAGGEGIYFANNIAACEYTLDFSLLNDLTKCAVVIIVHELGSKIFII